MIIVIIVNMIINIMIILIIVIIVTITIIVIIIILITDTPCNCTMWQIETDLLLIAENPQYLEIHTIQTWNPSDPLFCIVLSMQL